MPHDPPTTGVDPWGDRPEGDPGGSPRWPVARGLGQPARPGRARVSPGLLVGALGSLAFGLWLLVVSGSAGLLAALLHLLGGLVAVALLAVLVTLAHQARRLAGQLARPPARQLSRQIARHAAAAPDAQELHR